MKSKYFLIPVVLLILIVTVKSEQPRRVVHCLLIKELNKDPNFELAELVETDFQYHLYKNATAKIMFNWDDIRKLVKKQSNKEKFEHAYIISPNSINAIKDDKQQTFTVTTISNSALEQKMIRKDTIRVYYVEGDLVLVNKDTFSLKIYITEKHDSSKSYVFGPKKFRSRPYDWDPGLRELAKQITKKLYKRGIK